MQTQRVEITDAAWVEITQGSTIILAEGGVSGSFLVHFANSDDQPLINAPAHRVQTFQAPLDFTQYNLIAGQRVWVRSQAGGAFIVVTRAVVVYVPFVPSGSDGLITSNGNTFKSIETA
jgi:hypothetical protein